MGKLIIKLFAIYMIASGLLIFQNQLYGQTYKPKKAGICFRFDDFQSVGDLDSVRALFKKYNVNFTYALNSGIGEIKGNESYWSELRTIASAGNELADQSPSDVSHYIEMKTNSEAMTFKNRPGTDHVDSIGNKVCLKYTLLTSNGSGDEGKVDIKGNMVISKSAGEFNINKLINTRYTSHFYFPSLNKTVSFTELKNLNPNDVDTAIIQTFWKEPIDLGTQTNIAYKKITPYEISVEKESIQLMAEYSLKVFARHNLPLPVSFIHPGGSHPYITKKLLREALIPLGYAGGASYPIILNGINENNPYGDKQFALQGGDYIPEYTTVTEIKNIIANRFAKNMVTVSINHLNNLGALLSFSQMLANLEEIIKWCVANNIPIDTYKNWNNYLGLDYYNQSADIFPPIQNDFNQDNIPDGLVMPNPANIDKTSGLGYNNGVCFKVYTSGNVFSIIQLTGMSMGENTMSMSTRGGKDIYDYFNVIVGMPEIGFSKIFNVLSNTPNYTESSFDFDVPAGVNYIEISMNYQTDKSQTVYLSGIKIKSANKPSTRLSSISRKSNEAFAPVLLSNYAACNGFSQSQLVWKILKSPANLTAAIKGNDTLLLNPNTNKFWIGLDSVQLRVSAPDNTADTGWLYINSLAAISCKGQFTPLSINPDSTDKSYAWGAVPADPTLVNTSNPFALANPTQNTSYTLTVTNKSNVTKNHTLSLQLLNSQIATGPYDLKRYNGANSVSFNLNYPPQYKAFLYQIPLANVSVSMSGNTVTLTRSPSFTGNTEVKLFVTTPTCDAQIHTLTATTYAAGVAEVNESKFLQVYPNPFTDEITLTNLPPGTSDIEIVDINGMLIRSTKLDSNNPYLNLSDLANGFYIIYARQGEKTFVAKLLKGN